jgi:hypothetical protein
VREKTAGAIEQNRLPSEIRSQENSAYRKFVLEIIQPGLVGRMDGSVSTLAPCCRLRHAQLRERLSGRHRRFRRSGHLDRLCRGARGRWKAVRPRHALAARLGLRRHDNRGIHTPPYLIPDFWRATIVAGFVVMLELTTIAWINWSRRHSAADDCSP